jgi:hypothetical protein
MSAAARLSGALPQAATLAAESVAWAVAPREEVPERPLNGSVNPGPETRVLFHSHVLRRNFAGFPFWVSCAPEACARIADRARLHAAWRGFDTAATLATLAPESIGVLRERMRLPEQPATFPGKRGFKMLFTRTPGNAAGTTEHALLGETEHWTRIRTEAGAPSAEISTDFLNAESEEDFQGGPAFSRSFAWGLLMSNPAHAGIGLQCEAGVHLPALTAARKIPQVRLAMGAMGLELQPLSLREPGAAEAGYFRLQTRGGMDLSSEELHRRFAGKLKTLLDVETKAAARWNARDPNLLQDRMHRALRLLQEARRMDYAEMLLLTSFARAGVYQGIFPDSLLSKLETLRVQAQPAHLAATFSAMASAEADRDPAEEENAARAGLSRSVLAQA